MVDAEDDAVLTGSNSVTFAPGELHHLRNVRLLRQLFDCSEHLLLYSNGQGLELLLSVSADQHIDHTAQHGGY